MTLSIQYSKISAVCKNGQDVSLERPPNRWGLLFVNWLVNSLTPGVPVVSTFGASSLKSPASVWRGVVFVVLVVGMMVMGRGAWADGMLSVKPAVLNVPATSGTTTVKVINTSTGLMSWTANVSSCTWLSITDASGTNAGTIIVNYDPNSDSERVCTINIESSDATNSPQQVEIKQALGYTHCLKKRYAKSTLAQIAKAEETYHAANDTYSDDLVDIGVLTDTNYEYVISEATENTFTAVAASLKDNDRWTIDQGWNLVNIVDAHPDCTEDMILDGGYLIERMIIVAIRGILAAVTVPSLEAYVCSNKQREVRTVFEEIRLEQNAYFAIKDSFGSLVDIGFTPEEDYLYNYDIEVNDDGETYFVTASSKSPINGTISDVDEWTTNQDEGVLNTINTCESLWSPPVPTPIANVKPLLWRPVIGQIDVSLTPKLQAGSVSPAVTVLKEQWQISTDPNFVTTVLDKTVNFTGGSSDFVSYIVPSAKLEEGTVYYWRVKYSNSGGESQWSDVKWFRTAELNASVDAVLEAVSNPLPVCQGQSFDVTFRIDTAKQFDRFRMLWLDVDPKLEINSITPLLLNTATKLSNEELNLHGILVSNEEKTGNSTTDLFAVNFTVKPESVGTASIAFGSYLSVPTFVEKDITDDEIGVPEYDSLNIELHDVSVVIKNCSACNSPSIKSVNNGRWNLATTWDQNRTPVIGDVVIIQQDHTVWMETPSSNLDSVEIDGLCNYGKLTNLYKSWVSNGYQYRYGQLSLYANSFIDNYGQIHGRDGYSWFYSSGDGNAVTLLTHKW